MTLVQVMYPLKPGSPKTVTTADITGTDVNLYVEDLSVLPDAPNVLIIFTSPTIWERCKYTLKQSASGAGYVTIVRAGTEWASSTGLVQAFSSGAKVARNVFESDFAAIKANIEGHETRLTSAETSITTVNENMISLDSRVDAVEAASGEDPFVTALIFG